MMTEVAFRRYAHATGAARDVALLDVAQDYVLEYMRREGLFEDTLVFKGGTALRKYVFGTDGRFSGARGPTPAAAGPAGGRWPPRR